VPIFLKSGSLNFLEPSGPVQACNGIALECKPIGTRISGRPRKRRTGDIEGNMQIMGIRRWRNQFKERAEWKRITDKAETHSGL